MSLGGLIGHWVGTLSAKCLIAKQRRAMKIGYRKAVSQCEKLGILRKAIEIAFQEMYPDCRVSLAFYKECGSGSHELYRFVWEAPVAISVWLDNEPAMGLGLEFDGRILKIRQIQGVGGNKIPRKLRLWPKLLITLCMTFAEEFKLKQVRVYRAHMSMYFKNPCFGYETGQDSRREKVAWHQSRMRRRYDQTAEELGFVMKEDWGEWLPV